MRKWKSEKNIWEVEIMKQTKLKLEQKNGWPTWRVGQPDPNHHFGESRLDWPAFPQVHQKKNILIPIFILWVQVVYRLNSTMSAILSSLTKIKEKYWKHVLFLTMIVRITTQWGQSESQGDDPIDNNLPLDQGFNI